jgi:prepilin-type N-terminal cleavage/methylation domain-containing protein
VRRTRESQGFTLIEAMVVVAVIGIVAALAYSSLSRSRPRAQLAGVANELQALMYRARQEALARGRDVAVVFYPAATTPDGQGRILLVADEVGGFMAGTAPAGAVDYCTMTPTRTPDILAQIDLPRDLRIAAPARAQAFPFPYGLVAAPTAGCAFCTGTVPGGGTRGAVRYDSRGRAAFFADCGVPAAFPNGASVALTSTALRGSRVLAVPPTGGARTFSVE